LILVFDFRDKDKESRKKISERMCCKWGNLLNEYFNNNEGLTCQVHYVKNRCKKRNYGEYYATEDGRKEIYTKKRPFSPVLKLTVYAENCINDEELLNVKNLENFLINGLF